MALEKCDEHRRTNCTRCAQEEQPTCGVHRCQRDAWYVKRGMDVCHVHREDGSGSSGSSSSGGGRSRGPTTPQDDDAERCYLEPCNRRAQVREEFTGRPMCHRCHRRKWSPNRRYLGTISLRGGGRRG